MQKPNQLLSSQYKKTPRSTIQDNFIGCLIGGAIGDAFGAPVEFMSRENILSKHGHKGVTEFLPAYGKTGAITDDTQMTLFTAEGLLRAHVCNSQKGSTTWLGCIGHAYQRWLQTQSHPSPEYLTVSNDGLLWQIHDLHEQRAPGNTCLNALSMAGQFEEFALNDSKGCGGVMRVAPIGLFCWRGQEQFSLEECFNLASDAAQLTHGHPTGYLSAGAFAAIIYQILQGDTLKEAIHCALSLLQQKPDADETISAIQMALALSTTKSEHALAIAELGEGWVAEEALAISLYCTLVAKDFNQLMNISVTHDGDSDSTGAISGNLWGAIHGVEGIDKSLIEQVELGDTISDMANDLFDFPTWNSDLQSSKEEFSRYIEKKYPGH
ncbi:ADP-ribosylglycohydrolase family protein [Alteromonas sp. C1M14]|uniref:ADP-ribosylglycohydrolase family protein n=1 Tax=Alteromonas sp. C1M14 TaxID=2841567 RepID=UPI001C08A4DD|nr:ADP-ribosylglycohydrolase family protein [Alteromonas sp. C1M14]MBU2978411.1 ADP-ribosylglycohydrolase family protein [Alteromonas sp. C1M14]